MSGRAATDRVLRGRLGISVNDPGHPTPPGWVRTPLTDIADLGTGHTPSRNHPEYWDGGVPWIGIRDAGAHHGGIINTTAQTITPLGLENSSARLLPKETVCLSRTASVGYVVKMGRDMATSQDFVTWSCSQALDPDFLMSALLAEGDDIRKFGEGSTHTTIYFPAVKAFHLDLPPIAEQRRIVAKLDALTARIARARAELDRVPVLAKRMRERTVRAAFRGQLTTGWRLNQYGTTSKEGATALPYGWTWSSLGELADIKSGLTLGKKRAAEAVLVEVPYLRVANVQRGAVNLDVIKHVAVTQTEIESLRLEIGDMLLNEGGDRDKLGRGWVWEGQIDPCIHQNHVFRARLKNQRNSPYYVSLYANEFGPDYFLENGTQTTNLASISKSKISALPIPVAPVVEQGLIVKSIEAAFARADRLEAEAVRARKLLDRLESAILAKAFRGELVPQNPNDEPAEKLLERIRVEREAAPKPKRGRRAAS
ncbi:type I restriction endonuclease subunit S [Rhizobium leguminosarum]|uniref:restriction endonuclease subunit S n=1 Tax=Rhizobium leguminosarum TaxID=384 RepID=UPI001C9256A4|nr:restriction endonuclease subunit S [Rhizobium leguminosarum]MBY2964307.1 type I restriction endonuclease subunit S [Rhizobium leguminosarum]